MFNKFITILTLFFIFSCVATSGNKSAIQLYKSSLTNGATPEQISKIYGNYSGHWQGENGEDIYQYSFSKHQYDLVSYLPIINHFGWIKSENYEVLLMFDSKNHLVSEKKFYNQAKSRNSLVCNPQIYSCLRKIY
jgi:hypothetical protein